MVSINVGKLSLNQRLVWLIINRAHINSDPITRNCHIELDGLGAFSGTCDDFLNLIGVIWECTLSIVRFYFCIFSAGKPYTSLEIELRLINLTVSVYRLVICVGVIGRF